MSTVGIVGGGQLAQMLALAAKRMNVAVNFYAKPEHSTIVAGLGTIYPETEQALSDFCNDSDIILFEHEHVADNILSTLTEQHAHQCPALTLLQQTKDRFLEKQLLGKLNIPVAKLISFASRESVNTELPVVFKARLGGYDGRGQHVIKSVEQLAGLQSQLSEETHICEQFLPFSGEVSLVSVRGQDGAMAHYDISQNVHQHGILRHSSNQPNSAYLNQAIKYNNLLAQETEYVGTFAVEYFIYNGELVANEVSPRVHNSGHWTQDGSWCCQFSNHLRASLGWPLGDTTSHSLVSMENLIGTDDGQLPDIALKPSTKLHLYGKTPRAGRKLGHVNHLRNTEA